MNKRAALQRLLVLPLAIGASGGVRSKIFEYEDTNPRDVLPTVDTWTAESIAADTAEANRVATGAIAIPGAIYTSSLSDPRVQPLYTPGEFGDLNDLANTIEVLGGGAALGGYWALGGRGLGLGWIGVGMAFSFWLGWQVGTAINIGGTWVVYSRRF